MPAYYVQSGVTPCTGVTGILTPQEYLYLGTQIPGHTISNQYNQIFE